MKQISAKVSGRVQGISFRYYTQREASRLNLTGWVRNELDGTVSVVAEGPEENLDELLNYLRHGPTAARVTNVEVSWSPPCRKYHDFSIRWA